jgi:hypothetical protein
VPPEGCSSAPTASDLITEGASFKVLFIWAGRLQKRIKPTEMQEIGGWQTGDSLNRRLMPFKLSAKFLAGVRRVRNPKAMQSPNSYLSVYQVDSRLVLGFVSYFQKDGLNNRMK